MNDLIEELAELLEIEEDNLDEYFEAMAELDEDAYFDLEDEYPEDFDFFPEYGLDDGYFDSEYED